MCNFEVVIQTHNVVFFVLHHIGGLHKFCNGRTFVLILGHIYGILSILQLYEIGSVRMLSASYSSDDTIAINIIFMLIVAGVFIAILVWILHQISRQTRGIEEIYKLLYHMQLKNNTTDITTQTPVSADPPSYMQELIDDEKRSEHTEDLEVQNKTSPTNLIVGVVILGIILIAVSIIATVTT